MLAAALPAIPLLDQLRLVSFEAFDAPHVPRIPLTPRILRIAAVALLARHSSCIGTCPSYLHTFSWIFSPRHANRRHRLFCEISKNWAGRPLDSFETILKYLRTTRTSTGLRVRAHLVWKIYETGVKVTDAQMRKLRITPNAAMQSKY